MAATSQGTSGGSAAGGTDRTEWFDSHCHLQDAYLDDAAAEGTDPGASAGAGTGSAPSGDPQRRGLRAEAARSAATSAQISPRVLATLGRAGAAGVRRAVCIGTDPATSGAALALARASAKGELGPDAPELWATIGLHPHDAEHGTHDTLALLEATAALGGPSQSRLVAVGECGLDYHYDHSPRDEQRAAFAEQIAVAHRLGLALVIHARDAWDDLFDVLTAEGVPERTILHCFTGGPDEARRCLDAGMRLSFSGIITFKNAAEVREAVALCPLDRLLVETDSPFLAPVPHRGKANEPGYVSLVGAAVATVKGLGIDEIARSSAVAAEAVFAL